MWDLIRQQGRLDFYHKEHWPRRGKKIQASSQNIFTSKIYYFVTCVTFLASIESSCNFSVNLEKISTFPIWPTTTWKCTKKNLINNKEIFSVNIRPKFRGNSEAAHTCIAHVLEYPPPRHDPQICRIGQSTYLGACGSILCSGLVVEREKLDYCSMLVLGDGVGGIPYLKVYGDVGPERV